VTWTLASTVLVVRVSALQTVPWPSRDAVPLRLVHAYELPLGLPAGVKRQESFLRDRGERWIREAVADVDPALETEIVLASMPTAQGLPREFETASLLVLGTRGLRALTGLLVGSTSVAVAGHAHGPVVVVPGAKRRRLVDRPGPADVVLGRLVGSERVRAQVRRDRQVRKPAHDSLPAEHGERHPQVVQRRPATDQQILPLRVGVGHLPAPVGEQAHRVVLGQHRHGWVVCTDGARVATADRSARSPGPVVLSSCRSPLSHTTVGQNKTTSHGRVTNEPAARV
jgi:nucleotide-binding universal stress UspA family protein